MRLVREALGEARGSVWIVGGAVRDAILGRPITDVDLVTPTTTREGWPARVAAAAGGPAFPLSEEFGAWRVIADGRLRMRRVAAAGRLDRGRPRQARLQRERDGDAAGRRRSCSTPTAGQRDLDAGRPARAGRAVLPRRRAAPAAARAHRDRARRFAPDAETERLTRDYASRRARDLARADLGRAAPARDRGPGARRPGAGRPPGRDRGGAARARPRCAASSRATSTTSTFTATRSRCCASSSPSSGASMRSSAR